MKAAKLRYQAFDNINKKMYNVEEISFDKDGSIHGLVEEKKSESIGRIYFSDQPLMIDGKYEEHFILREFTGFKNWFEGDIIENDTEWYLIAWDESNMGWEAQGIGTTESIALCEIAASKDSHKQGNMFENPTLIDSIEQHVNQTEN